MSSNDEEPIHAFLRGKIAELGNSDIKGPVDTEYGFGWEPTKTYWIGSRRIHLYGPFVEIADTALQAKNTISRNRAKRRIYMDDEVVWAVFQAFLIDKVHFEQIPGDWIEDAVDSDKFVPDPPDKKNPGNIAQMLRSWIVNDILPD